MFHNKQSFLCADFVEPAIALQVDMYPDINPFWIYTGNLPWIKVKSIYLVFSHH